MTGTPTLTPGPNSWRYDRCVLASMTSNMQASIKQEATRTAEECVFSLCVLRKAEVLLKMVVMRGVWVVSRPLQGGCAVCVVCFWRSLVLMRISSAAQVRQPCCFSCMAVRKMAARAMHGAVLAWQQAAHCCCAIYCAQQTGRTSAEICRSCSCSCWRVSNTRPIVY